MQKILLAAVGLLILLGFALYMTTYTVNYAQTAVVTTFGEAGEGSVKDEAALYFKWPAPIQRVTVYDTRQRYFETPLETQQTRDRRQVVLRAFMTYAVDDPLAFYRSFGGGLGSSAREDFRRAEDTLLDNLRTALSEVSNYTLDELFSHEGGESRLHELEEAVRTRLVASEQAGGAGIEARFGLTIPLVRISQVGLPEQVTQAVFERMSQARATLAAEAEERGRADAQAIRDRAEADAQRIRAFAQLRAAEIENRGDSEAAEFLQRLSANPTLATFLKSLELLEPLAARTTLIVPTTAPGMGVFSSDALERGLRGELPEFDAEASADSETP